MQIYRPNHVADLPGRKPAELPELGAPRARDHLNVFAPHQIPQPEGNMNGWILEDNEEEEEEEEDLKIEEEIKEESYDDDDAEVINPYEEADPSTYHHQIPTESESEDNGILLLLLMIMTGEDVCYCWYPSLGYHTLCAHSQTINVAPTTPVTPVDHTDSDDPSPRPTRRPRHDDPYVMVRMLPLRDEGDDAANNEIMPPRAMTQAAIEKLVSDRVAAALAQDRATRGNTNGAGGSGGNTGGNAGGQGGAPPARECTNSSFMKCNPTSFHRNEGAVELCRWFEKAESVFSISECAERNKVKFVVAILQGRALTWWNSQVATLGLEVANAKSWNDMKIMMREEFCPPEEIQRMEVEL
ncbi:hypothetical protein Tco_1439543 [Tanacetum coccineum]